uniref:UspA domain-containing protein n=1 Tax=Arcella intermedia TaxID=1963864 RepID=A0A6B2LGF2_9EUKA
MVALDDSVDSSYAFNYAALYLNRQEDHLFLFNVHDEPTSTYGGYATPELLQSLTEVEEKRSRKILVHYGQKAKQLGISYTMMKGASDNTADLICKAVKQYNIRTVVTGRRAMGDLKRFFVGSTSRYLVENAECNVVVVKCPVGPEEEHIDKQKVIQAEESERIRRLAEELEGARLEQGQRQEVLARVKEEEEKERAERVHAEKTVKNMDKLFHVFAFQEELKQKVKTEQK